MRLIESQTIVQAVKNLCIEANYNLKEDVTAALRMAREREKSETGREILGQLLENAEIARKDGYPLCQDTGVAVFFIEMGQEVSVTGAGLYEAVNQGVREGYEKGFLRKSMVVHPLKRVNTGDNTPAIIHMECVPGDRIKIDFMAKGGGCENMSGLTILTPAAGIAGVKEFVIKRVREAGSNPCPPIIVGVGIGGNFEKAAILSKKALLRPIGSRSTDPDVARLEEEILNDINQLGIGPQGLGGSVTALSVQIEVFPCHIASLPVAVNIECHSHRHTEVIL